MTSTQNVNNFAVSFTNTNQKTKDSTYVTLKSIPIALEILQGNSNAISATYQSQEIISHLSSVKAA
jgi:hypothetical protein